MFKIKSVAVVDDLAENRLAAQKAIVEVLPNAEVWLFSSAKDAIAVIEAKSPEIDLVLSDLNMEDHLSGYRVACAAWSWNIPTVIVSGGIKTHTTDQVVVGYPSAHFHGEKDDPSLWKKVLEVILSGDRTNNGIITALSLGKRTKPSAEYGQTCAAVSLPMDRSGGR